MGTFFDAALGFPAVLFTIFLVPVVLYWFTVMLGGVDADVDGAADADVDLDAGADGGEGAMGLLGGWWQGLGLADVPITMSLSVLVVFGWFVALIVTGMANAADVSTGMRLVIGLVTMALAVVAGALAASVTVRPLARLFVTTEAEGRRSFVGRTCTVRTTRVTESFGQAEATDPSGATVLLQVRAADNASEADLHYGAAALIVDYDPAAEVFLLCPVDGVLRDLE